MMNMKIDQRPKLGRWAPGEYNGTCKRCNNEFIGDKRALICADCAYTYEERPHWTVCYNIAGKWIGTGWEFFDLQEEAKVCYEKQIEIGNCPVMRPYNHSHDKKFLGSIHQETEKDILKKRVISLHIANPTLKDCEIARHFDISTATVTKYLTIPHSHDG